MAASLGLLVLVLFSLGPRGDAPVGRDAPATPSPAAAPAGDDSRASARRDPRPATPSLADAPSEAVPYVEGLVYGDIDLREAKELMPDNLYWKWGVPTKDETVLAERDAERRRRNEAYGRVLAGDAGEDEVKAYYDAQRKLSQDYLEFSEFMLRRHRDNPNDQFVGMLELAMKLNAEKLARIDADLAAGLEKARAQEKARQDWKREQEEFNRAADEAAR